MELLIPGLLLVALMVYASTRIKKSAARAFEEETIDTDYFSLIKPEGFLHLINGDTAFAFQAYSKEFGKDDAENLRQAIIDVSIVTDKTFDALCDDAKSGAESVIERPDEISDMKARSIEVEREIGECEMVIRYLIVDTPGRVFQLQTNVLKEYINDYFRKINEMEDSLRIKK
jgi:hypothetical protein